jgi:glycosyltransferase involved in cell wall biosynthesis
VRPRVLVVIPAHDEAESIEAVLLGLRRHAPDCDRLVVDDGSTDATSRVVEGLGERRITLACNLGYGRALQAGMKVALERGYNVVACVDADGQHRPEDVPRLVCALQETRADLVIGSRYCDGRPYVGPISRRVGQRLFSALTRPLIGRRIHDTTSGLKALSADACAELVHTTFLDFHVETLVRFALTGRRIVEIPVQVDERRFGQSMHARASVILYPLRTLLLTAVALLDVLLTRRKT